jgi:MSHA biogenesis protein MshP
MNARPPLAAQRGFGIITAVFLLVVLSALGAALLTVFNTSQASSALDVQGERAYQAARAGLEWELFNLLVIKAPCDDTNTFPMPATSTMAPFTVTVVCTTATGTPGGLVNRKVKVTACNMPSAAPVTCPNPSNNPDYVQRTVQAEL